MTSTKSADLRSVWVNPVHFFAFGFGAGTLPKAPGTWGTLMAVPLYLALQDLSLLQYLGIVFVMAAVGVWICEVTASDLGVTDPPGIVWDEMVGYLITMFAAPKGWLWVILGFGLFRLFDIWKPWPISRIDEQVKGGLGIMADDWIAGFFGFLVLQLMLGILIFFFGT